MKIGQDCQFIRTRRRITKGISGVGKCRQTIRLTRVSSLTSVTTVCGNLFKEINRYYEVMAKARAPVLTSRQREKKNRPSKRNQEDYHYQRAQPPRQTRRLKAPRRRPVNPQNFAYLPAQSAANPNQNTRYLRPPALDHHYSPVQDRVQRLQHPAQNFRYPNLAPTPRLPKTASNDNRLPSQKFPMRNRTDYGQHEDESSFQYDDELPNYDYQF